MGAERIGAPRTVADFEAVYAARRDPKSGMIASLDEAALVPCRRPAPQTPRWRTCAAGWPRKACRSAAPRTRMERDHARRRAHLIERGVDPDAYGLAPPPPFEPPPSLDHIPAYVAAQDARGRAKRIEAEAWAKREQDAAAARITAAGGTPPDLDAQARRPAAARWARPARAARCPHRRAGSAGAADRQSSAACATTRRWRATPRRSDGNLPAQLPDVRRHAGPRAAPRCRRQRGAARAADGWHAHRGAARPVRRRPRRAWTSRAST